MRILTFIAMSFVLLMGCSRLPEGVYRQLDSSEYRQLRDSLGETWMIDVRTAPEFLAGHIPGAKNISYLGSSFEWEADKLPRLNPVFVYCQSAHRSPLAARKLYKLGFTEIIDLKEGFKNWSGPVEKGKTP